MWDLRQAQEIVFCRCLEKEHSWRNLGFVIIHLTPYLSCCLDLSVPLWVVLAQERYFPRRAFSWILWEGSQEISCQDSWVLWTKVFFFPPLKKTKVGFLAFWVSLALIYIPLTCLGAKCALILLTEGLVALSWSRYEVTRREGGERKPVLAHVPVKCWAHKDGVIETSQMFVQGHFWCAHP